MVVRFLCVETGESKEKCNMVQNSKQETNVSSKIGVAHIRLMLPLQSRNDGDSHFLQLQFEPSVSALNARLCEVDRVMVFHIEEDQQNSNLGTLASLWNGSTWLDDFCICILSPMHMCSTEIPFSLRFMRMILPRLMAITNRVCRYSSFHRPCLSSA